MPGIKSWTSIKGHRVKNSMHNITVIPWGAVIIYTLIDS